MNSIDFDNLTRAHPPQLEEGLPAGPVTKRARVLEPLTVSRRVHHECHLMLWQLRGATTMTLQDHVRGLGQGHVCMVQAGVTHELEIAAGAIILPLFLRLGLPVEELPVGLTVFVDEGLHDLLLRLMQHNMGDLLRTGQDVEADVVAHLRARPRSWGMPMMPSSREAAAVAIAISRRPESSRTIDELAADTFVSTRTIGRQFKAETGMTPQQWRAACRLSIGAELIAAGTAPSVVGAQVGYTDEAAFRRAFKARFGMTPRQMASSVSAACGQRPA